MNNQIETITGLNERKLKILIKESVKESINAEVLKLRAVLLPYVSNKEQKEIEKKYGKPSCKIAKSYDLEI